ncbi:MAG TPA: L-histidine N(alpha)-methyltransferase [Blastocatellia bacterium]|nr:L-histidine N(alpha)-methyltransferase [Blastocatellia bacterium]
MLSETRLRPDDRLKIERLTQGDGSNTFEHDVREGLTRSPKRLPPKYFYDDLGSRLFEAICALPEYYLTRAESEILHASAKEIVSSIGGPVRLLELGSGSAEKTRYLIEALLGRQTELHYLPVDISELSLELSSQRLLRLYPGLRITAFAADYFTALETLARRVPADPTRRTVAVFLGSNIGNFGRDESREFLRAVRKLLRPEDALLLGADLKKSPDILIPAYDDALGVTAAFNLNLLSRINRELNGDFDVRKFGHNATYNADLGRIEIRLISLEPQRVRIGKIDLEVNFDDGESIRTENSYKFDLDQLSAMGRETGFVLSRTWFDQAHLFSFNLFVADGRD